MRPMRPDAAFLRERRRGAYEGARPDVQELVPTTASRILDLGCSSGALGAALKARQGAEVVGVELDPSYAEAARTRLDQVIETDLDTLFGGGDRDLGRFDCLVAADVLEHLRDPWSVLRSGTALLATGGTAVVSLPNARHWETLYHLGVKGTWPRREEGIFDRDHLRWFTLRDAERLLDQAGLRLTRVSPQYRLSQNVRQAERLGRPFHRTPLRAFFVFQYVLAAVKVA